ncbi:MAG: hypothetical protein GY835_02135 [bacterium]|nr:hypothetical protein [bacterium]
MTMTKSEQEILHSHLESSQNYLEFGSGESTIYASKTTAIQSIDSVESSQRYIDDNLKPDADIALALSANRLRFHVIDIGETKAWGNPKDKAKMHLWPNYSLGVFTEHGNYDLVLVDGRFRVACTLNSILNTPDNCTIVIHDFWNRPEYHIVLRYLEVKDRADTLGVFGKRDNIDVQEVQSLIKVYQYLPDDKRRLFKIRNKLSGLFGGRS